jgi:phosphotriesterase-related protein
VDAVRLVCQPAWGGCAAATAEPVEWCLDRIDEALAHWDIVPLNPQGGVSTVVAVPTVRGPVDSAELGTTLMHEHIFVLTTDVQRNYPQEWDEEVRVADAVTRLTELRELGVHTIVDPTVVGLGRDIPRIQRINQLVDLNIIVATGIYTYHDVPAFFRHRGPGLDPKLPDPMVDLFVGDLTEGIAGTGVRAGLLKCAIDAPGLTRGVERVLRAVAAAHLRTGAPIMVHTHPRTKRGLEVAALFTELGVASNRVQLAHCGDSADVDHLTELAEAGFLLGMDRFGLDANLPTPQRVATIVELVRRGLAAQLVLSHDAACYIDWLDPALIPVGLPNWNYGHIHADVLPALREQGVTEAQINQMLVDNPRRYFEAA